MNLAISEIKPNPFKKHINDGKLYEERVEICLESIEHGTLPENFTVRKNEAGEYELTTGHHKLEALRRKKGEDYKVAVNLVDYSDEVMVIDLFRENATQGNGNCDFETQRDGILLAREFLRFKTGIPSKFNLGVGGLGVSTSNGTNLVQQNPVGGLKPSTGFHPKGQKSGSQALPDSPLAVARFLSRHGATIGDENVRMFLAIADGLAPELQKLVGNEAGLSIRIASGVSNCDAEAQRDLVQVVRLMQELNFALNALSPHLSNFNSNTLGFLSKLSEKLGEVKSDFDLQLQEATEE